MLYVHANKISNYSLKSVEEVQQTIDSFCALDDANFLHNLYERGKIVQKLKDNEERKDIIFDTLKFRHGISPVTKNIRNIRFKRKPNFDKK